MRDLLASLLQQLFRCPRAQRVIYARCLHRRFWALALPKALQPFGKRGRKAVERRGLRTVLCTVLTDL
jgi:hypothetical protein